uniref:C-type lectin domain-containing protein n=1 Tax=Acrobeloides nanus TaxID=290746 RepID=A0A914CY31_9BILA
MCESENASLASIHSEKENNLIQDFASAHYPNPAAQMDTCWIGIHDPLKNNSWQWTDHLKIDFTNWLNGSPISGPDYKCGILILDHINKKNIGKWANQKCISPGVDVRCGICKKLSNLPNVVEENNEITYKTLTTNLNPLELLSLVFRPFKLWEDFILLFKKNFYSPNDKNPTRNLVCPSHWAYDNLTDRCYTVFFYKAEYQCKNIGGHLVSIHSEEEHRKIYGTKY